MLEGLAGLGYVNAILLFCALIFFHELGHYLVARFNRVTVEVFSIGFGPELVGWHDRHGTRWRIAAIPLGGYVRMLGEDNSALEEGGQEKEQANIPRVSFASQSIAARAAIIAAGPIANFLLAAVLYAGLFVTLGVETPGRLDQQGIGGVVSGTPAARAGLETGDRIIAINGRASESFNDLVEAVSQSNGAPLDFQILPADPGQAAKIVTVTPEQSGSGYRIGVMGPPPVYQPVSVLEAIIGGFERMFTVTGLILEALWETISGQRGTEDLGGPIRIIQLSSDMSGFGMAALISFAALLSVNLGLINLLPIPILDGGHLVFLLIEALRGGRPLTGVGREWAMRVGLSLILGLMIFTTINDIMGLMR